MAGGISELFNAGLIYGSSFVYPKYKSINFTKRDKYKNMIKHINK